MCKKEWTVCMIFSILMSLYMIGTGMKIELHGGYLILIVFSLILNQITPRLTCLSYVIPAVYLMDQLLMGISYQLPGLEYRQMITLTAILHLGEGILSFWFGAENSKIIITYKGNNIAGGYQSYKRWMIPLLLFSVKGIYVPVFAMVVYCNETFSWSVEEKTEKMGIMIAAYGGLLFVLSTAISEKIIPTGLLMGLMPLMHEMIFAGDKLLEKAAPLYTYPSNGIRLLGFAGTTKMPHPFERGDVILEINGQQMKNEESYEQIKKEKQLLIHIKRRDGRQLWIIFSGQQLKKMQPVFLPEA